MGFRRRFERMIAELSSHPSIVVREAKLGAPTSPAAIAAAERVAGDAFPPGMRDLYTELGSVDIAYAVDGTNVGGRIHIPSITDVWDHAAHEEELWFDWLVAENPDHPFLHVRPIDRFVEEAYAVLYPVVPGASDGPAKVHFHTCGESLIPTGLTYEEWLDWLFVTRGALYWLLFTTAPRRNSSWVERNVDRIAALFPDFYPPSLEPPSPFPPIDLGG